MKDRIPTPYEWMREEKFKIPKGSTYINPTLSMRVCAVWMEEYIKKYYKN